MLGTLRLPSGPLARQPSRGLHLLFGACGIPHPSKAAKGGEDAFFCDEAKGTFGVADGVGGSASAFVDPGEFSRALLRSCDERLDGSCEALRAVLAGTAQRLREAPVAGSSTLLVGQLEPEGATLRLLNIGDCGAMLLRPAARRFRAGGTVAWPRVVLRTAEQTHYFNCPYQLDGEMEQAADADEVRATARVGDVLLVATDGVLDNLFDSALQMEVARRVPQLQAADEAAAREAVDALAAAIGEAAAATGAREDEEGLPTPFAAAAAQEGYTFHGGKRDDVAVLAGVVRAGPPPAGLRRRLGNLEYVDSY